ncbi:hypothetical protein I8748_23495 [Nostoc sp. CENA67]|uniref:Uncharacterized protein n=1 Tax=Amazonocrinis nigriterrae CENA67 TaxID=2794033 RepID=A0A8J7HVL3_9NOST|nr:hypothetical protein [Amazonocrinis nigriterrae]MBH8565110.1 hypothetical protein [Amazonocrinis nigriterrae CENA67]
MNVLVTTSKSVLKVNILTKKYSCFHQGKGLYYGIAYSQKNIFIAARNQGVCSHEERAKEKGEILVFDFSGNLINSFLPEEFGLRDLHQIIYYKEILFATCSYENMIAIYKDNQWYKWYPKPEIVDDFNHFNSIHIHQDKIYILGHNWDRGSEIYSFINPFQSMLGKLKHTIQNRFKKSVQLKLIESVKLGLQSHNIWIRKDEIITLSSKEGKLVSVLGLNLELGKFPRGLCVLDDFILIGLSELAERNARDFTSSSILVFNKDFELIHEIDLKNEGLILEIRCPGYFDECYPYYLGQPI